MTALQEGQQVEVTGKTRFQHGFHVGAVVTLVKRDADDDSWWASGPPGDGDPRPLAQWIGDEDVHAIKAGESR